MIPFNKYKYKRSICGFNTRKYVDTSVIYVDSAEQIMWDWFVSKYVPQTSWNDVSKTFSHQMFYDVSL